MIKINDKTMCSGCYSCVNICPQNCIMMKIDEEGFWYPQVNIDKCINCELCVKKCPVIYPKYIDNIPLAYGCYNLDDEVRKESSSGGIFTLLASIIIKKGGIVYGAAFDRKFNLKHIRVDHIADLNKLRGSKYLQSEIGNSFDEIKKLLIEGKLVYFSGTPCQIDGLLCYLNKKYDNLICQDIICHGVPSPKIWQYYLKYIGIEDNAKILFRDKSSGWETYSFTIEQKKRFSQIYKDNEYMNVFLNDLCLRPSCYKCKSKTLHRKSDITLADFWGINEICPELFDNKGTSLVLINSKTGERLFHDIMDKIKYKEVNIDEAIKYNPSSFKSVKRPRDREKFMSEIFNNDFPKVLEKYTKLSIIKKCLKKIENKLSS